MATTRNPIPTVTLGLRDPEGGPDIRVVDVTDRVQSLDIARGKEHPLNQTTVGTCSIRLRNDDQLLQPEDAIPSSFFDVKIGDDLLISGRVELFSFSRLYGLKDRAVTLHGQDGIRFFHDQHDLDDPNNPGGQGDTPAERFNRVLDDIENDTGIIVARDIDPGPTTAMASRRGQVSAGIEFDDAANVAVGQWGVLVDGTIRFIDAETLQNPDRFEDALTIGFENLPIVRGDAQFSAERVINDVRITAQDAQQHTRVFDADSIALNGDRVVDLREFPIQFNADGTDVGNTVLFFYATADVDNDVVDLSGNRNEWPETVGTIELFDPVLVFENGVTRQSIVYGIKHRYDPQRGWGTRLTFYSFRGGQIDDIFILDSPTNGIMDVNKLGAGGFSDRPIVVPV